MALLRIIAKTLLWTVLIIVLLPFLLAAALYVPPVQQWAVQTAARYASEATGMQISIGRLGISFPLDLNLKRLTVIDRGDTLVAVSQAVADLNLKQALHWRIGVEGLDLNSGQVNIALRPDTTEKDTSKTQLPPLEINIRRIGLNDVRATFSTVGDTLRATRSASLPCCAKPPSRGATSLWGLPSTWWTASRLRWTHSRSQRSTLWGSVRRSFRPTSRPSPIP